MISKEELEQIDRERDAELDRGLTDFPGRSVGRTRWADDFTSDEKTLQNRIHGDTRLAIQAERHARMIDDIRAMLAGNDPSHYSVEDDEGLERMGDRSRLQGLLSLATDTSDLEDRYDELHNHGRILRYVAKHGAKVDPIVEDKEEPEAIAAHQQVYADVRNRQRSRGYGRAEAIMASGEGDRVFEPCRRAGGFVRAFDSEDRSDIGFAAAAADRGNRGRESGR